MIRLRQPNHNFPYSILTKYTVPVRKNSAESAKQLPISATRLDQPCAMAAIMSSRTLTRTVRTIRPMHRSRSVQLKVSLYCYWLTRHGNGRCPCPGLCEFPAHHLTIECYAGISGRRAHQYARRKASTRTRGFQCSTGELSHDVV
jgi:hypothetical protein